MKSLPLCGKSHKLNGINRVYHADSTCDYSFSFRWSLNRNWCYMEVNRETGNHCDRELFQRLGIPPFSFCRAVVRISKVRLSRLLAIGTQNLINWTIAQKPVWQRLASWDPNGRDGV